MTREGTGIVMTTHFHRLLHLNKVTAATTPLMEARAVISETVVFTETTATMVTALEGTVDEDPLSLVLTIATTLNHQADSPIVSLQI